MMLLVYFFSGCDGYFKDTRTDMTFKNNADYSISIYSVLIIPWDYSAPLLYPDTTLPLQKPSSKIRNISPHGFIIYNSTVVDVSSQYRNYNTDTISFFVFSTDSMESLGWDSIRSTYGILQRYDISLNEYLSLYSNHPWKLPCFPPSSEMRNIKMWPPYGTYDANGNRVN